MRGGPSTSGRSVSVWLRLRRFLNAPRDGGYTVIEILIVLAVTAGLFISAAIMIIGRQNRTAFEQAVRNIHSQIQSTIDEVVVGHYPNNGSFQCTASGTGPNITAGSAGQGENGGCIFMGRAIQFGRASTDPEQFTLYTIAGLRLNPANGSEVTNRTEARPRLVAPTTASPGIPDKSTSIILEAGLSAYYVRYGSAAAPTPVGGISIWQSLATVSGGTLTSSAQAAHIGPVVGTQLGMTQQEFVDAAATTVSATNTNLSSGPLDDVNGVRLCFVSGNTEQSGLITLGGNARRLSVVLEMKSNRTCS